MYKTTSYKLLFLLLSILGLTTTFVFSSNIEPRVLILRLKAHGEIGWGGVAAHTLSLYKNLLQIGVNTHILVPADSIPEQHLKDQNLPYFTFKDDVSFARETSKGFGDADNMYKAALDLCKSYNINIIHVNFGKEIEVAKKLQTTLRKTQKIGIVYQHHGFLNTKAKPKLNAFVEIDALISVDKPFIQLIKQKNLSIKYIKSLPPMTQINLNTKIDTSLSKDEFFKQRFNLSINTANPIICCVAHFFKCKNHETLFKAMHKLVYAYKIPVQLVLAGEGSVERTNTLKQEVRKLQIQDYVHFLGFVTNVPELLFYSDIKALVSTQDSFALTAIEAALLKKPMVISKEAGVANTFIFHNKTGLLCNPNSIEDIALQIKYLIENPSIAQKLGNAAYNMVSDYYLSNGLTLKYVKIYKDILKENKKSSYTTNK